MLNVAWWAFCTPACPDTCSQSRGEGPCSSACHTWWLLSSLSSMSIYIISVYHMMYWWKEDDVFYNTVITNTKTKTNCFKNQHMIYQISHSEQSTDQLFVSLPHQDRPGQSSSFFSLMHSHFDVMTFPLFTFPLSHLIFHFWVSPPVSTFYFRRTMIAALSWQLTFQRSG